MRIVSVRFETVLFVSVVSIQVRNTETNRKNNFLVSRNKPKHTRNRSCFGLFRFEPKIFFFRFEDTLIPPLLMEMQTGSTNNHNSQIFFVLAAPIFWWDWLAVLMVRYKGECHVSSTSPNWKVGDLLLGWSERKRKKNFSKMAAK